MGWVSLASAGFTLLPGGGTGNFTASGDSVYCEGGGTDAYDNAFSLSVADPAGYNVGNVVTFRLLPLSFSAASGGSSFGFQWDLGYTPQEQYNESGSPNAEFLPEEVVMQIIGPNFEPFSYNFYTTGPSANNVFADFIVEVFEGEYGPPPAPEGDPLLVKDSTTTLVSQYVPAQPVVPPTAFHMYATPLPLGYEYFNYQGSSGGPLLPNSLATFTSWPQFRVAATEYTTVVTGTEFKTFDEMVLIYGSGFSIQSGWIIVTGPDPADPLNTIITGFIVPVKETTALPPKYHPPAAHMTFVDFSDYDTVGYGYPTGPGPFVGRMTIPTLDGVRVVTSTYHKDFRGVLLRVSTDPLPTYCTQSGPCRIVALSNFPGRAAAPAVPAQYSVDTNPGWDAGGNSINAFEGDCATTFTVVLTTALAVGLTPSSRTTVGTFESLSHSFYFAVSELNEPQYYILERGRRIIGPRLHTDLDEYAIVREGGVVRYYVNDALVYTSQLNSSGEVRVGSALYRAGDGVI